MESPPVATVVSRRGQDDGRCGAQMSGTPYPAVAASSSSGYGRPCFPCMTPSAILSLDLNFLRALTEVRYRLHTDPSEHALAANASSVHRLVGSRTVNDTSGVSRVRPAPIATFNVRFSLRRYE